MRGGSQTDASEPRTSLECACSRSITRQQADQQINRALGRSTRDESTIKQQQESTCSQHSENPPQPFSLLLPRLLLSHLLSLASNMAASTATTAIRLGVSFFLIVSFFECLLLSQAAPASYEITSLPGLVRACDDPSLVVPSYGSDSR